MARKFIGTAIKHPGALHEDLNIPQDQKIPAERLAEAAMEPGKVGQRARFAKTLRKMNKKHKHKAAPKAAPKDTGLQTGSGY